AARVWAPFRELNEIVQSAVTRRQPGAVHDLQLALRKHKPDFIGLLKKPSKNGAHRDLVRKSHVEGIPVQGEQRRQTFSQSFIAEALILSDLFELDELAAVELLMAGELQLHNYPGLTRGLVAVLLFFDGQRSLVSALRALAQAREGKTWTVGVTQEMQKIINDFIEELLQGGLVRTIIDKIKTMDLVKEIDRLQKDRALGPPKHRKQVTDLFTEVRQTLGDILFCLAAQRPLRREDTLCLIDHLRQDNSLNADETLDSVTLSLLVTLWYCFDVSILQKEDNEELLSKLPVFEDSEYMQKIHRELLSNTPWSTPGLKAAAQFSWAVLLRQTSQFNVASGGRLNDNNDCFDDDERLIEQAMDANIFPFLRFSVIACSNFHTEEFYLRRLHGLISDFIYQMPLKIKEIRNHADEICRSILAHQAEGLEPSPQRKDLHEFMLTIGDLYMKDPLNLQLALEYWCPPEPGVGDMGASYRVDPKQVALFKFVRVAGDLLPSPLFLPYIHMLTGLATGPQCAHNCFNLLRSNGEQANPVSWDHIFGSLHQYYSNLRQETYSRSDSVALAQRQTPSRCMTPQELEAVCAVLKLTRHVANLNDTCRSSFCENQQWSVVMVLFGLLGCSVSIQMKGEILITLASFAQTPVIASTIWQTLESSQVILPTIPSSREHVTGLKVELEEIESRNEEFHLSRGFLELMGSLTQFPVPMGLGAGTRSPGLDPYLDFILNSLLLKFNTRAYKLAEEKWLIVTGCLDVLLKLLADYELRTEDLLNDMVDVPNVGVIPASKPPGLILLCLLLSDSHLFKMIQLILEEALVHFEQFVSFPGREHLEKASLLCLQLLEEAADRHSSLEKKARETASSIMVSSLERLLLAINPRTRKADYLINITKFVVFSTFLPNHTLSAVRILCHVCSESALQSDIVILFTADKRVSTELLQGFVECLDSNTAETMPERTSVFISDEADSKEPPVQNAICDYIIQLMLVSLDQAAPNLAHWLLGFQLQKPVIKTTLQDPGVLDSPKTCLHSILTLLEQGLGSREGPSCLLDRVKLAELGFHLIYALCANKDTSPPTLRYLRTTHDFLYRQLQHLPLDSGKYGIIKPVIIVCNTSWILCHNVADHQAWLLKTIAIELRMTSLNRQRSHTHRLVKLLLGDEEQDLYSTVHAGEDGDMSVMEKESSLSLTQGPSTMSSAKQIRHRLLGILDTISFEQSFPPQLQVMFFDKTQIEGLVRSLEYKSRDGSTYCDVRALRQTLLTELANQQGPMVAGQRPHIMEEIQRILETAVEHNDAREALQCKKRAFEAWRQVVEVMLTSVPHDLLSGERRQSILFDLLQELLIKVSGEDVSIEAIALVSDVLLTLMANLRHCFLPSSSLTAPSASDNSTHPFWAGKGGSSRTVLSTSLQIVLRGLIDFILQSSGGNQKVRVNLYGALLYCLQIAKKPVVVEDPLTATSTSNMERLLSRDDSEFEKLAADYMETITAYGDSFMETLSRDACDGHHVGRMLAFSVLDTIISMDRQHAWLGFLCGRGYLQHLVDSLASEDNSQLLAILSPQPPNLRALYIFQSKMSLLTRIALTGEGASILLHGGALEKLSVCSVLSLRPEVDDYAVSDDDDEFLPSPLSRYRSLLFGVLRFCLALLTSLGGENKEAATQVVMLLIISHGDVFTSILRSRKPTLNESYLRELSLTTAVIARANYHTELGADLMEQDTANMEFKSQRMRLQDQMLALLPHYSAPETIVKQLRGRVTSPTYITSQADDDNMAQLLQLYQEIASNLTAYCCSLIANIDATNLNHHLLFGPSLNEISREGCRMDEVSATPGPGRKLGLGIILLLLQQSACQFKVVLDSYRQHAQQLTSLSDLTAEDLKQLCGDSSIEKLSSQQRQEVAKSHLVHIVSQKSQQLQHYVYIVENCLYITWRHLEFFLVQCIPADRSSMTTPTLM
ncbi:unnamed protein product, partial [Lymnaea stagnalis]